jgi:hypothetical protein
MSEGAINKVLYTVDQRGDTTAAEKKTARDNIGAVGADDTPEITDQRYKLLQSPVLQTFSTNAVIDRLEQDAQGVTTVHCSYLSAATGSSAGLMSAADKAKLNGIQAGAEVNVQSDWAQTDTGADDFIRNKPAIPVLPPTKELVAGTGITIVEGADEVTISSQMDAADKSKLDGIQAGAEVNVQADWTESDTTSDAHIRNKPNIPTKTSDLTNDSGFLTAQVNADWNAVSGAAEILNKPALSAVATTGSYTDLRNRPSIPELSWQQNVQDSSISYPADQLKVNRDNHVVTMHTRGGSDVHLGYVAPVPDSADDGKVLTAVSDPTDGVVVQWADAPESHTVGFIDI